MIAGVLAVVKRDAKDGKGLAWRVGQTSAEGGNASMNELSFKRLIREQDRGYFLLVRRAVQLAGAA